MMKKFLARIALFLLAVLLLIVGFYTYKYWQKKDFSEKITKKNIIIGDSNIRWSINDSILSNYANYSTGGETYLFAYTKLRVIARKNKIDTLMLSFSPHNIVNNMWWDDAEQQPIRGRMPSFYQDFQIADHWVLMKYLPKNYLASLMDIGKSETSFVFETFKGGTAHSRLGSYMPEKQNETMFKPVPYPYKTPVVTDPEIEYMDKIKVFCSQNKIHLILINPPKNYLRKDFKNYNHPQFYEVYKNRYSDIDFLDFSRLQLPKNAYWDVSHVDIVGAEFFSNFLRTNGIKELLQSKYNLKNDHR